MTATKTGRTKATRIAKATTLYWGLAYTPVGLYKASGDPKDAVKIATAGPNGLPLEKAAAQGGKRMKDAEAKRVSTSGSANVTDQTDVDPLSTRAPVVDEATPDNPITTEVFEVGSDVVLPPEKIRRGFLVGTGDDATFVDATDALEYVDRTATVDEMRIRGFMSGGSMRSARVVDAYYLGAGEGGDPGFVRLLWEAMREEGKFAVVTWKKGTKESIGVLKPEASGALVLLEMRWAADMRDPGPRMLTHNAAEVTKGQVAAAIDLVRAMAAPASALLDERDRDEKRRMHGEVYALATAGKIDEFETTPAEVEVDDKLDLEALFAASAKAVAK